MALRPGSLPRPVPLVAFDLETTGVRPDVDRIIEFCFIELDDDLQELSRWTEFVNPGIPVPPEVVAVTHLTPADLEAIQKAPPFPHFAARIQALVQGATLIGHHAAEFDIPCLHHELVRAGQPGLQPNHPCVDTLQIERTVNSHNLGETYLRYTGKPMDGAHRSAADTLASVEVLRHQRERHKERLPASLEDLTAARLAKARGRQIQWLDFGRKFYADGEGNIRFGRWSKKHADKSVTQVQREDPSYLSWMLEKGDFPADVKAILRNAMMGKPA